MIRTLTTLSLALALLVSTAAVACDHAKAAAKADGKDCCAGKAATTAKAGGKDCPHGTAAVKAVNTEGGEHKGCPLMALKDNAAHGCKMSAEAIKAAKEVRATGKVLCASCDLKTASSCASVFQTATKDATYTLCGEGMAESLTKLTKHGEVDVTVHGKLVANDKGDKVLCVEGFSVGTI